MPPGTVLRILTCALSVPSPNVCLNVRGADTLWLAGCERFLDLPDRHRDAVKCHNSGSWQCIISLRKSALRCGRIYTLSSSSSSAALVNSLLDEGLSQDTAIFHDPAMQRSTSTGSAADFVVPRPWRTSSGTTFRPWVATPIIILDHRSPSFLATFAAWAHLLF